MFKYVCVYIYCFLIYRYFFDCLFLSISILSISCSNKKMLSFIVERPFKRTGPKLSNWKEQA